MSDELRSSLQRLVPVALGGLERMLIGDRSLFCFKAVDAGDGAVRLEGESHRYTAMALIGLARQRDLGRAPGLDTGPLLDRISAWAPGAEVLGDAGLVLWAQVLAGDGRAEALARAILSRRDEELASGRSLPSMETGFLLIGLAEAMRAGIGGLETMASDIAERLLANRDTQTGIFPFSGRTRRKNLHKARIAVRLGSFASNVYPTMGLAAYHRASGNAAALSAVRACSRQMAALQGAEGQWWWVFHVRGAVAAVRYPVYTVHQDAMGPMMMLAASLADSNASEYDDAMLAGLRWFEERSECRDRELIDQQGGMIRRAVQRDDPAATGLLGLSRRELARMGRAAWLGGTDRRSLGRGLVCAECRPYHLGWVLLAAAMLEERASA